MFFGIFVILVYGALIILAVVVLFGVLLAGIFGIYRKPNNPIRMDPTSQPAEWTPDRVNEEPQSALDDKEKIP